MPPKRIEMIDAKARAAHEALVILLRAMEPLLPSEARDEVEAYGAIVAGFAGPEKES